MTALRNAVGDMFFYILYFQEPGVADAELAADPARTMRRMLAGAVLRAEAPPDLALFANDGRGSSTGCPSPTACRAGCRPPS